MVIVFEESFDKLGKLKKTWWSYNRENVKFYEQGETTVQIHGLGEDWSNSTSAGEDMGIWVDEEQYHAVMKR